MRDNNENYKQKEAPEWETPVCLWWLGSVLGQVRDAGAYIQDSWDMNV